MSNKWYKSIIILAIFITGGLWIVRRIITESGGAIMFAQGDTQLEIRDLHNNLHLVWYGLGLLGAIVGFIIFKTMKSKIMSNVIMGMLIWLFFVIGYVIIGNIIIKSDLAMSTAYYPPFYRDSMTMIGVSLLPAIIFFVISWIGDKLEKVK